MRQQVTQIGGGTETGQTNRLQQGKSLWVTFIAWGWYSRVKLWKIPGQFQNLLKLSLKQTPKFQCVISSLVKYICSLVLHCKNCLLTAQSHTQQVWREQTCPLREKCLGDSSFWTLAAIWIDCVNCASVKACK